MLITKLDRVAFEQSLSEPLVHLMLCMPAYSPVLVGLSLDPVADYLWQETSILISAQNEHP